MITLVHLQYIQYYTPYIYISRLIYLPTTYLMSSYNKKNTFCTCYLRVALVLTEEFSAKLPSPSWLLALTDIEYIVPGYNLVALNDVELVL